MCTFPPAPTLCCAVQVADAKHPTVHKELREAVVFNGPMDAVYRGAKGNVVLSNGKGALKRQGLGWGQRGRGEAVRLLVQLSMLLFLLSYGIAN